VSPQPKQTAKAAAAARRATLKRLADEAIAREQERLDEELAPAAQRHGTSLRGPRVVRDGNTFKVGWNAMAALLENGQKRIAAGKAAMITEDHAKAACRLVQTLAACESISAGVSSYGERASATPQTGWIPTAKLEGVAIQRDAYNTLLAARKHLGGNWNVVLVVVLLNRSVASYADEAGLERQGAVGVLRAALTSLIQFWSERDARS
jgi:hypothetical protein